MPNPRYVFLDDALVPWDEAKVHVASVAFKFGAGVFEGIRAYWNAEHGELYVLQLDEHLRRLEYSQRFMRFDTLLGRGWVGDRVLDVLRANEYRENVHIMATAFVSGFGPQYATGPISLAVTAAPRTDIPYGETGCRVQVSSWHRVPDDAMPMRVKCNANYQNGRLASMQAKVDGYDTAIMLNRAGKVAEGPGMCVFLVRDGVAITPSTSSDILESITRSTVITLLAEHLGVETVEREVDRSELAAAEEIFFCGTAWEVTPVIEVDRLAVGDGTPGALTRRLREQFLRIAEARTAEHPEWRTPVYAAAERAGAAD